LFSFTWIGISPDDRWAVFPVIKHVPSGDEHVLLVLDQLTGRVDLVPGSGPVGFTRDSKYIVSYGSDEVNGGEDVWLIDPESHVRTVVDLPFGAVTFTVSRFSDDVIASPVGGAQDTVIYNTTNATMQSVPQLWLGDYVSRTAKPELFVESSGGLFALDLAAGTSTAIPTTAAIDNINACPSTDRAFAADFQTATIYPIEMRTRAVGTGIALPSPFLSHPRGLPGASLRSLPRAANSRLGTRRDHDGDAIAL
jgi:hypothetical protein